jgi:nitrate/nitrite transporter NarK
MVWVLLACWALLANSSISPLRKGLLTAIPLLGGSLFRPILGVLGDRLGAGELVCSGYSDSRSAVFGLAFRPHTGSVLFLAFY